MPQADPTPAELDALAAKARRQAVKLNHTLDELAKRGVSATICPPVLTFAGQIPVYRVRLVLTEPAHEAAAA